MISQCLPFIENEKESTEKSIALIIKVQTD